jgi:hypothetical protein
LKIKTTRSCVGKNPKQTKGDRLTPHLFRHLVQVATLVRHCVFDTLLGSLCQVPQPLQHVYEGVLHWQLPVYLIPDESQV